MDCAIILTVLQPVLLVLAGVLGVLIVYMLGRAKDDKSTPMEKGSDRALSNIDTALRLRLGEWWPVTCAVIIILMLALVFVAASPVLATWAENADTQWESQIPLYLLLYILVVIIVANALTIYIDAQQDAMTSTYVQMLSRDVIGPDKATRHRHAVMAVGGLIALGVVVALFYWWFRLHGKKFSWSSLI